uniref:Reverse transcriptase domain-containing protein n=1 Tax=Tanacetum cinerariifolium TaxID=118510 RepID=A0A699HHJ7_TANCI|nr:reverse transcriptase domain-containing protein [Tanacetum cinerariifolium]
MAANGNGNDGPPAGGGDLLVPDLRTMEELCQPTLNGRGGPIAPIANQATKNSITTFEQIAKMFLGKYFPPSMVTKLRNEITNFRQCPDELLFKAWERYKILIDRFLNQNMLPVTQIDTFYNGLTLRHHDTINAATGGTFMKRCPEECFDLIENMTAHHNDWDTSAQRSESSSSITSSFDQEIIALKAEMVEINKNLMKLLQINQQVKAVTHSCETCGGPHAYNDCPAIIGQTQNVYAARAYNQGGSGMLPSNTITNLKEDYKGITTRSGIAYKGPTIPTTFSPPKVVERETKVTKDTVPPTNNGSTKDVQPSVVQVENRIPNYELVFDPVEALVSAPKPNLKSLIPYPSRLNDQKLCEKAKNQMEKFFQIFQDLNFNIRSFLKTGRALIDVYEGELTLRVGNKAVTFNLDNTLRYSSNYDVESINQIDVIDVAYEENSQVLGFSMSGNPTPSMEPIVSTSSPTLTHSDFLLEETDSFLAIEDEPISLEINDSYYDSKGDILLFEEFLNDDPSSPPLPL